MPRTTADSPLTTRAARERLEARKEPYWRGIEGGIALGYRRGAQGGSWMARVLDAGRYREERLGRADDTLPADGAEVLDFRQAQSKAVAWASRARRVAAGLEADPAKGPAKPYTVADAIADYLADMKARGARSLPTTHIAADAHILPALGTLPVPRLTREKVRAWHRGLSTAPARGRGGPRPADPADPDAPRRRQATANRILTILKAALNHAREEGRTIGPDDAWRLVKPFRGADAPKVRYLSDDECVRLANACPPDFRALVTAALLTGCRYGELSAMRAGDLDHQAGSVNIPRSKSGKARHVVLTDEGREFFARVARGKAGDALLFERDAIAKQATRTGPAVRHRARWKASDQFRAMAEACAAARITPAVSFHVLRHTYASRLAARAVPLPVIAAQLGHADTRMTERHYAHLAPSYVADTVRAAFTSLGIGGGGDNVAGFTPRLGA
jgi:integrase